jgi:hypothetical protein
LGYSDDEVTVRLVLLCRGLHRYHGENPFFLPYRLAAEVIGTDRMTAFRRMRMLEADAVIRCVSKGDRKSQPTRELVDAVKEHHTFWTT